MRLTRVHTTDRLQAGGCITLQPMSSNHLIKVLRLRAGARVLLFNGDGLDYAAEIVVPKVEAATLEIIESLAPRAAESPLKITLIQGLCRGDKMDWVLEKATELGVHRIIPVMCERSEVHLDAERALKRREHWQRVVVSACEQSGRACVPEVEVVRALDQRLALGFDVARKWTLEPGVPSMLRNELPMTSIALAVGPEGGFSERDLAQLNVAGFAPIGLGARILRTETAGLAALAAMQALFGDFAS
jgi:16S rRNA (uracil1498-N3)-methyltransferase